MNTYQRLNALELVDLFTRITGGRTIRARDASLLKKMMIEEGLEAAQVVLGVYIWKAIGEAMDVPSFLRGKGRWVVCDALEARAELSGMLSGNPSPSYWVYLDLRDGGMADARATFALEEAKKELERFCDTTLSQPPSASHYRIGLARVHSQ